MPKAKDPTWYIKPRKEIQSCVICGAKTKKISAKGYCPKCAYNKVFQNISNLRNKEGKSYKKWKENLLKSLEKNG